MVDRIKKFLKNTKRIWPKLDLRVSAKSGKVNFEKCDYNRSRSEIFKIGGLVGANFGRQIS